VAPAQSASPATTTPTQSRGESSLLVLKADPASAARAAATLQSAFAAERVKTLTQSQADVWRIPSGRGERALQAIRGDGSGYAEVVPSSANPLLPEQTVRTDQLTAAQRTMVQAMVGSLDEKDYRVTAARPAGLSADVLTQGLTDSPGRLSLRLVSDQPVELTAAGLERRSSNDFTWRGHVVDGTGDAILVVRPEGVNGSVRTSDGTFLLRPLPEGRQLIMKVDPRQMPREHPPLSPGGRAQGAGRGGRGDAGPPPAPCPNDQGSTVDVLVVYSGDAGKRPELLPVPDGFVQLAVDETNEGLTKSGLTARLRLVGVKPIGFAETHDFDADVAALQNPGDGRADAVHGWRSQLHADVVAMLVAEDDWCGMADTVDARAGSAFVIVSVRCATGYYSFGHELGHLFGARHDEASDSENRPFPYGHGFVEGSWRTIMAYGDACADCPRILRWSNPQVKYPETGSAQVPSGVAGKSDNARVLMQRMPWVTSFQCSGGTP